MSANTLAYMRDLMRVIVDLGIEFDELRMRAEEGEHASVHVMLGRDGLAVPFQSAVPAPRDVIERHVQMVEARLRHELQQLERRPPVPDDRVKWVGHRDTSGNGLPPATPREGVVIRADYNRTNTLTALLIGWDSGFLEVVQPNEVTRISRKP